MSALAGKLWLSLLLPPEINLRSKTRSGTTAHLLTLVEGITGCADYTGKGKTTVEHARPLHFRARKGIKRRQANAHYRQAQHLAGFSDCGKR
jgi:hypothetical protein